MSDRKKTQKMKVGAEMSEYNLSQRSGGMKVSGQSGIGVGKQSQAGARNPEEQEEDEENSSLISISALEGVMSDTESNLNMQMPKIQKENQVMVQQAREPEVSYAPTNNVLEVIDESQNEYLRTSNDTGNMQLPGVRTSIGIRKNEVIEEDRESEEDPRQSSRVRRSFQRQKEPTKRVSFYGEN